MKTQILKTALMLSAFFLINVKVNAQSTAASNTYNASNFIGWNATSGDLPFKVNNTTKMTLQNTSGNFGIGSTSPSKLLDVNGDINISSGSSIYTGGNIALRMSASTWKGGYGGANGNYNAIVGVGAGNNMGDDGEKNVIIGYQAGYGNGGPDYNTYVGYQSGYNGNGGEHNTYVGASSGFSLSTTGNDNSYLGYEAGYYNQNGDNNTYMGYQAGKGTANYSTSLNSQPSLSLTTIDFIDNC